MKIVTNKKLVRRNRQLATWLFLGTLGILIGGFILINYSFFTGNTPADWLLLVQIIALPVVFVLTVISVRMTNHWQREPYPHDAIENGLKGISKRSILYNYYHSPARHILIAPQGVFAITTRWHDGNFTVEDDKWKSHKGSISRFFSAMRMDGVGQPIDEAKASAKHVQSLFEQVGADVEVQPLVLFINDEVELEFEDEPSITVLYTNEKKDPNLSEYMRELNRQQKDNLQKKSSLPLTDEQIEAFEVATLPQ